MTHSSAGMPYIKSEPDDFGNNPNRFMSSANYGNSQGYGNQFNNQQDGGSIDPSELSMPTTNYGSMPYNYGGNPISSSYGVGVGPAYTDNELLESLDFGNNNGQGMFDDFTMANPTNSNNRNSGAVQMDQQNQIPNVYSSTPDGPPIQSPFLGNFDYNQFRPMGSLPTHMSPHQGSQFGKRPSMQAANRKSSDQRTPLTPRTAGMAGLQIGTPESGNLANGRPIRAPNVQNRHSKTLSGQYDSTPGSFHSYLDSPLSSPGNGIHHAGISETLGTGHHASLPAKVDGGLSTSNTETAEAKKRRRRASHNAVERRRRDNINERIHDLSHLVPQHRLEDDKVKKQLQSTGPLSPTTGAASMSPPNANNAATSLLAGAAGRRAASTAGNITIGLPIEEKEKGPNKGDILNGAVAWTRDLMWALHQKYQQEDELLQYIQSIGGQWPFQVTEDDKRMRSEVMDAMEKNDSSTFSYSRTDGTGLRVPRHTNVAGERVLNNPSLSPQSNFELSPGFHSGGSGTNSGSNGAGQTQYWHSAGHTGISFKEEDEFMDMN
ncbi:hypothetical protein AYO21_01937 [Fonsecaea monophora]|uniref:BHLH domain-containing protein n=2 Tax=Fonsecaea TaxID=40354 RepID=A0A0D2E6L0_9EURO|nr:uncharacterized protein Z517_01133 [Fonsecaea pedrosoi CBS 271.37]XP_022515662.1 hypothetical protein AYO21_01937 [Fonsecaea monophora]KIW85741.1 hypothetical protein Z517_01133 [Fonsecaea pedrosoi CBS 271.37]OAG43710.1 hypothetical protein AYO21_01937 [Fonsecaea monophora]